MESRVLANIASRLEERDSRSKWDWAVLGCAMLISAGLAGAGAFFYAKSTIETDSFSQAIARITQDTDAGWCHIARGQIVPGSEGSALCAIHMPEYQPEEGGE